MSTITAAEINKLRQQTGAGMMDCRKALVENNGDFQKAVDFLRKKGQKVAELRSGRETKEGVVITEVKGTNAIILRLSCETDFVAKNEDFIAFAKGLAKIAIETQSPTLETLKNQRFENVSIADKLNEQVTKIGEKIEITEYRFIKGEGIADYIHGNYRLGVLVVFNKHLEDKTLTIAKDIAMQIAAMNPLSIDTDSIPKDIIEREKAIILDKIKTDPKMAGKPEEMLTKITEGKLAAFFKEKVLLAQPFIKEDSKNVATYLKEVDKDLKIIDFKRVSL